MQISSTVSKGRPGLNRGLALLSTTLIVILVFTAPATLYASEKFSRNSLITIKANDEALKEIFKKISKTTGYEIRFDADLGDSRVSLVLNKVTLKEAIDRLLQAHNHIAVWDESSKKVTLFIFDHNSPPVSITGRNRLFQQVTETTTPPKF
jgi:type II secretory pathway component GspD/PulD (secretin)